MPQTISQSAQVDELNNVIRLFAQHQEHATNPCHAEVVIEESDESLRMRVVLDGRHTHLSATVGSGYEDRAAKAAQSLLETMAVNHLLQFAAERSIKK